MNVIEETERNFVDFIGVKHAIMVSSGTAALHTAYLACDLTKGVEVIVPAYTFSSTVNMLLDTGATPIFADINKKTYLIDVDDALNKVNKHTAAIIIVNLFGKELSKLNISRLVDTVDTTIIDSAQCIKPNVNYGTAQCFSFYRTKNFSCFEGGAITTNNDELAKQMRIIMNQGEDGKYNTVRLGYNYRMSDLQAVMINHQFTYHYIGGNAELGRFGPENGHYPRVVYEQPLYKDCGFYENWKDKCPIAEALAKRVRTEGTKRLGRRENGKNREEEI